MLLVSCSFLKVNHIRIDDSCVFASEVKNKILAAWGFDESDIYLLYNGKQVSGSTILTDGIVHAIPRLVGGKGGFGSMLRAIGAQIEKTTNREACRDLSGRRLRDINEEKRLKNWIAQQAEREQEAAERKRRKLERLREEPKHNFHDETYEEERAQLAEKVSNAVEQGFSAATQNNGCSQKRKATNTAPSATKKKKKTKGCLWLDADEEDLNSSDGSDDSGNEDVLQPGTSSEGRHLTVDDGGRRDSASASSDNCKNEDLNNTVEDSCKTATEAANK